jgi:hypothetical protein
VAHVGFKAFEEVLYTFEWIGKYFLTYVDILGGLTDTAFENE